MYIETIAPVFDPLRVPEVLTMLTLYPFAEVLIMLKVRHYLMSNGTKICIRSKLHEACKLIDI